MEANLAKLTEERRGIQSKMDMLANLVQHQSLDDVVEIREQLDEPQGPGLSRLNEPEKAPPTDEQIMKRLDQLQDEEDIAEESPSAGSSIDVDEVDYEEVGPKRPVPPSTARPRRSSLPALTDGIRKKERKSVSFAPFQGRVPEREGQEHPIFKQALQMMMASGKFRTMDEGSIDSDEASLPNYRGLSADSALPRLKVRFFS